MRTAKKTRKLWLALGLVALLLAGCAGQDPLRQLEKMNIPFTVEGMSNAISLGNEKAVKLFLQAGMDPDSLIDDVPALVVAADKGFGSIVSALLSAGSNPDSLDKPTATTALYAAAHGGHSKVVNELLKSKADPNLGRTDGFTPLHAAAQAGSADSVQALLAAGAQVNVKSKDSWTPLHLAVMRGNGACVKLLLDAGAKKDIVIVDNETQVPSSLLFYAAGRGKADVVEALLAAGFNANERLDTWSADTPLLVAAASGHLEAVQVLVQHKADVNASGYEGVGTPLIQAIYGGHAEVVRFLIANKADLSATAGMDDTRCPLCVAAEAGHDQILQILMDAGLDINHPIRSDWEDWETCYWTPLMHAAYNGNKTTVAFLLSKSADPKVKDYSGSTAADLAAEQGYDDIWNMLK